MTLDFLKDATNVVIIGANGVGKTTIARNLAHQALVHGHTVLFTSAGQILGDLTGTDSASVLRRRLRHYTGFQLLAIDEVGYLSYSDRHADLLFEIVSRRYESKSTLITTNRPFAEWQQLSPRLRPQGGVWFPALPEPRSPALDDVPRAGCRWMAAM